MKHVPSAEADLSLQKTQQIAKIRIHTDIHNGQLSMVQSGQDIDRCPFLQEIKHHLPSDFLGICTDSFSHNAVIGREHISSLAQRPLRVAFPNRNKSRRNVLETAETAWWFGQMVEACTRLLPECRIRHTNFF